MRWLPWIGFSLLIVAGCSQSDDASNTSPAQNEAADAASRTSQAGSSNDDRSTSTTRTAEVPSADGILIRYEVRGANQGREKPTLVFIHGWCCKRTFWEPQLAHFAQDYRGVAIDLAGHGKSDAGREKWTMEAFGHDVAAVVHDVGAEHVVLVGHSMGGPVILEAANILGDKVLGLIPVDAFTDPNEAYTETQMADYRKPFEDDFPQAMHDALHHEHDFFSAATTEELKERITTEMTAAPPNVGVGAFQGMLDFANERQRPLMKEIKVPFVCINARRVEEKVADGKRHAPQFEVVSLPDSGHFLMMEHPEAFNVLLEKAIAGMMKGGKKGKT